MKAGGSAGGDREDCGEGTNGKGLPVNPSTDAAAHGVSPSSVYQVLRDKGSDCYEVTPVPPGRRLFSLDLSLGAPEVREGDRPAVRVSTRSRWSWDGSSAERVQRPGRP